MGVESFKAIRLTFDTVVLTVADKEEDNVRKSASKKIQIMLVKRDEEPFDGMWSLPGGFIDHDKSIDECVNDKLFQKTGLDNIYKEQLYTYGNNVYRDPRDRVVSIGYIALVNKAKLNIQDHSKETKWFWVEPERSVDGTVTSVRFVEDGNELNTVNNIAFDHSDIIIDALNRLAGKLMYTDIGFNMLNDKFTVYELEQCYTAIIGRNIPGFRRIISPKIELTEEMDSDSKKVGHRPSRLYRYNKTKTDLF